MSETSYTALVITLHNLGAISTVIMALLLSLLIFAIFLRRSPHRLWAFFITLAICLIVVGSGAQSIFLHKPIDFELVRAG